MYEAYLTPKEADGLSKYAQRVTSDIVEIGTFRGGGTTFLADSSNTVWTIDNYHHYLEREIGHSPLDVYKHLQQYPNVVMLIGDSSSIGERWGKPIGLLFIDGDHHYEGVKRDFAVWGQLVGPGGFVWFHDAIRGQTYETLFPGHLINAGATPGVVREVNEVREDKRWELMEEIDTSAIFRKKT